jgi:hypothetical protein
MCAITIMRCTRYLSFVPSYVRIAQERLHAIAKLLVEGSIYRELVQIGLACQVCSHACRASIGILALRQGCWTRSPCVFWVLTRCASDCLMSSRDLWANRRVWHATRVIQLVGATGWAGHRLQESLWCCIELLDIGGSMGIVPRQESVPTSSMQHRKLLKWQCWFAWFSARARRAGKKLWYDPSRVYF